MDKQDMIEFIDFWCDVAFENETYHKSEDEDRDAYHEIEELLLSLK